MSTGAKQPHHFQIGTDVIVPAKVMRVEFLHSGAGYVLHIGEALELRVPAYLVHAPVIRSEVPATRWIPVGERPPDDGVLVVACWSNTGQRRLVWHTPQGWAFGQSRLFNFPPTHWMPLLEAPK